MSKKWTSAGCVVIPSMKDRTQVCVVKPAHGYAAWSFPKGQVDKGESIKAAAVREVREETGLHVKILPGRKAYVGRGVGGFSITHYFLAVKTGGSPRPTEESEIVKFVSWEDAKSLFLSMGNKRDVEIADLAFQALKQF